MTDDDLRFWSVRERDIILQLLQVGVSTRLSIEQLQAMPQAAGSLRAEVYRDRMDYLTDGVTLRLRTAILAEQLPTERVAGVVTVPRWASPWQHAKDRWRDRWWLAWWVRRHPVNYVNEPVHVTVPVRAWWAYPHTPHVIAPGMGYSVLKTQTEPAEWPRWADPGG